MDILVTGGAGYIASHMALHLLDAGHNVHILDDLRTGYKSLIPNGARFIQGNAGDKNLLADFFKAHRIEAILHFAGSLIVEESVKDPLAYYDNNIQTSLALFNAARRAGVKAFIFSSTAAVYGSQSLEPLSETAPINPLSPYGQSKYIVERLLLDSAKAYGLPVGILRYFNVAGADPFGRAGQKGHRATHLIKLALDAALGRRKSLSVYGQDYPTKDGTGVRDYIHVSDLVQAHALLLERLLHQKGLHLYNCGYGHGYSVLDVIDAVRRVSGRDFQIDFAPRRAGDSASSIADNKRLIKELGWRPLYDNLDIIIEHALSFEKNHNQSA